VTNDVAVGPVAGAALGARLLMRVSNDRPRVLFCAVLALRAAPMLREAFEVHLFRAAR
jgi:hypothetical protein